jgi:CMP-N,N'-diacetyllegionaminic acid synthase
VTTPKTVAIIPARGGSKGLPGKNIRSLCGVPLIAHTIRAAHKAESVECVVVSTDCPEIANIAVREGAEIIARPRELATDTASASDVYLHAMAVLCVSRIVALLPTSPLRTAQDIDGAMGLFFERSALSVVSFSKPTHPPEWACLIIDGRPVPISQYHNAARQWLGSYMPNGAIFALTLAMLDQRQGYYGPGSHAYIMPKERSVDIDDECDFLLAEAIMSRRVTA